jgi:hypothetical protein
MQASRRLANPVGKHRRDDADTRDLVNPRAPERERGASATGSGAIRAITSEGPTVSRQS